MAHNKSTGTILAPDGQLARIENIEISDENATLLRRYKKFLASYGLREALYCNDCWDRQSPDGCEAHVTDSSIVIKCRCKLRTRIGQSF
jgi:hypothetical protein